MRPSLLVGALLVVLGAVVLAIGLQPATSPSPVAAPHTDSRPQADAGETPGSAATVRPRSGLAAPIIGGLAIAAGLASIGIGMGRWSNPRRHRKPTDSYVQPE